MQRIDAILNRYMSQLRQMNGNPMVDGLLEAMQTGDMKRGEQMADNICKSMGVTREEALRQARAHFGI